LKPTLKFATFG